MPQPYSDDAAYPAIEAGEAPLHGYRGNLEAERPFGVPAGLAIAISRETGSRGGTIAARAGEKLGWEVYSEEMLEFGAQNIALRQDLLDHLSPSALAWIEEHCRQMREKHDLTQHPNLRDLTRLVLTLAVQGNVILLGRGAGFLLPSQSTLHVRLVAPLADRVAYLSQWMRLTEEEADAQVRQRDHSRTDYLATHFHRQPNDVHLYDVVLNTSLLGEERCADVIAAAAKAKMSAFVGMD